MIIFLDFDGVLHPDAVFNPRNKGYPISMIDLTKNHQKEIYQTVLISFLTVCFLVAKLKRHEAKSALLSQPVLLRADVHVMKFCYKQPVAGL